MRAVLPRILAVAASFAMATTLAHAQGFNRIGNGGPAVNSKAAPPPPALPGASSNTASAAPSNRSAADMDPNEALFDAINRGDIGAARDAISRGAELSARNVLGMTPMELSVDLGRNDISFLLLSMRGDSPRNRRPSDDTAEQALTKPTKQAAARQQPAKPPKAAPVAAPAAPQTARLFANDGGSPNPSAGFLGFGGTAR